MSVEVRSRTWARLGSVALAPFLWVERARGRWRLVLLGFYALVLALAALLGWRALSIRGLPDIGEPFDVARLGTVVVADSENAVPLYRQATARLKDYDARVYGGYPKSWEVTDWEATEPGLRRWVDDNRVALGLWLRGTERPKSLLVQPKDLRIGRLIEPIQSLRTFARLALLEGSRRRQAGDASGAWQMYRAVLRSSRHAGEHGATVQRMIGQALLRDAVPHVALWTEDPKLTAPLLRRALADVGECLEMTAPISELVRAECFAHSAALADASQWKRLEPEGPEGERQWYSKLAPFVWARNFLHYEPERSQRVLRLIVVDNLAHCDRPRSERPALVSPRYMIYAHDSRTPAAVRVLDPKELQAWADSSALSWLFSDMTGFQSRLDGERYIFDVMRLEMAVRCYKLEDGTPPPNYGALLGSYLTSLPDGFDPGDAVTSPPPSPEPAQAGRR
jgi:hypothetical protein